MNARSRRRIYTALFLVALAAAVGLILIKGPFAPVHVETVAVARGDLHPARFGVGTVEARYRYQVGPARGGRLSTLAVDHGDRVRKGQVLGRLDPVDLEARLEAARAAERKAELAVQSAAARRQEVRARLDLAEKEARRYRELGRQKQVSQDQVDAKVTEARALSSQLRAVEADLEAARRERMRAQAEREAVEALLDELRLLSPVDGLVVARNKEPGSVVMAGTPVLELIDPDSLWVRTRIDQKRSGDLALGQPAEIHLRRNPEEALSGRVVRLELIADSLTEERWVDIAFDTPPRDVALGSLANVVIRLPVVEDVLWIPAAALRRREGRTGVWVLDEGRARFRPVTVGVRTLDGRVQVLEGLVEGERIILYSRRRLEDDLKVRA